MSLPAQKRIKLSDDEYGVCDDISLFSGFSQISCGSLFAARDPECCPNDGDVRSDAEQSEGPSDQAVVPIFSSLEELSEVGSLGFGWLSECDWCSVSGDQQGLCLSPFEGTDSEGSGAVQNGAVEGQVPCNEPDDLGEFGDVLQNTLAGNFRFQGKCFHLTYRGHLSKDVLFGKFGGERAFKYYSIVHEVGTHKGDGGEPYAHTHFYGHLHERISRQGARCFDVEGVHPYVQKITSSIHEGRLYWEYHRKAPEAIWQSTAAPQDPALLGNAARIRCAIHSGTLLDAAAALGIEPRTVGDIKAIREERVPAPPSVSQYGNDDFQYVVNWMHSWQGRIFETCSVLLYGGSGLGKTERAVSTFTRCLLVRSLDDARDFNAERYDGIVFDDANISHFSAEQRIHLVDYTYITKVRCRYADAVIPAGTKRIFTTNKSPEEFFKSGCLMTDAQFDAIKRRCKFIHIANKLFK